MRMRIQRTLGHLACGVAAVALAWTFGMLHSRPLPPDVADGRPVESPTTVSPASVSSVDACRDSPFSPADLNFDFRLDDEDWRLMKGAKGTRFKEARYLPHADMLKDLDVDDEDENIFCDFFNGPITPEYADHEYKCLCSHKHRDFAKSENVGEYLRRVIPEK